MKEIKLTRGMVALVDDEDYENVNQYHWCANKYGINYYAVRSIKIGDKWTQQLMHWIIMGEKLIDHEDNNGLNNQRSNLRKCTYSQNQMNKRPQRNGTSIYKGVHWRAERTKWVSKIKFNEKTIRLGCFVNEIDAARAYDSKAVELFGEFANINFKEAGGK